MTVYYITHELPVMTVCCLQDTLALLFGILGALWEHIPVRLMELNLMPLSVSIYFT